MAESVSGTDVSKPFISRILSVFVVAFPRKLEQRPSVPQYRPRLTIFQTSIVLNRFVFLPEITLKYINLKIREIKYKANNHNLIRITK